MCCAPHRTPRGSWKWAWWQGLRTVALALVFGAGAEAAPPDVVLILADDLGYGDVGYYNPASKIPTPHIDQLAAEGVALFDAHSPSAVCTPSRYSLLTGRYAWRGMAKRGVLMPWGPPIVEADRLTLADVMKRAGYATALVGKWHLGFEWPWRGGQRPPRRRLLRQGWSLVNRAMLDFSQPLRRGPTDAGFESYFGDDVANYPPYVWIDGDRVRAERLVDLNSGALISTGYAGGMHGGGPAEPGWELDQVMPKLVERAVALLEAKGAARGESRKPLFLNLWLTAPHTPVVPLPDFDGKSQAGSYGDFVVQLDDAVGQIVGALERSGRLENTLLIVTSDNGPESFSYRTQRRFGHDPAGGLRGRKGDLWEGGHRVPFVVSWPAGGLGGGRRVDALVSQIDLYATLAALVGASLPPGAAEDSRDAMPALRGQAQQVREDLVYQALNGARGLRKGRWAYLRGGGFGRGPEPRRHREPAWVIEQLGVEPVATEHALYDLERDPSQRRNRILDEPAVAKAMEAELRAIETRAPLSPSPAAR